MKSPFVNELEPDRVITTSFLVHSKEIRQKKSGDLYLSLLLGDRTGDLDAKMWDNVSEVIDGFERDDFVKVKGLIQVFHNRPQLTIHKIRRMDESEIEFVDYFPSSKRNTDEMWAELRGIVAAVANPHLKALLESLLDDPDVAAAFPARAGRQANPPRVSGRADRACALALRPGAHGGAALPECRLRPADHGRDSARHRQDLRARTTSGVSPTRTRASCWDTSISASGWWPRRCAPCPASRRALRSLVEHMILSHHGQLEFGSPKLPQFPEALLLHYLDDLDSKMECMRALIENDRQLEGCFTTFNGVLSRAALKKERYLGGEPPKPPIPATDNGSAPSAGPSTPAPAAAQPLFAPAPASAFADKLKQALHVSPTQDH